MGGRPEQPTRPNISKTLIQLPFSAFSISFLSRTGTPRTSAAPLLFHTALRQDDGILLASCRRRANILLLLHHPRATPLSIVPPLSHRHQPLLVHVVVPVKAGRHAVFGEGRVRREVVAFASVLSHGTCFKR